MYYLRDVNDNYLDFLGNPFVIAWKLLILMTLGPSELKLLGFLVKSVRYCLEILNLSTLSLSECELPGNC
jgi:hypothetical protein